MNRILVLGGIIGIIAGAVLTRLFFLQISRSSAYEETAARQHMISLSSIPLRGDIFFADKDGVLVPAAITQPAYALVGNPTKISNPEDMYERVMRVTGLDREEFMAHATGTSTYAIFRRDIPKNQAEELMRIEMTGMWLAEEERRIYPEGETASHMLGFVGYDGNERVGRYGVEQQYEEVLAGFGGTSATERKQGGFLFSFTKAFFPRKKDGADIVLTVDPHIQTIAHRLVRDLMEQWRAASAGILVIQPRTGAILAMDSLPGFDPNQYSKVDTYDVFLNPFSQKVFEMGSIVKPLTLAAGLDAHAISQDSTYYDAGSIRIRDAEIKNYDGKGRGWQSIYDILDQSLNTGAVFVMQQLGMRQFRDYMERFGLGSVTGIDLPQEIAGDLRNLERGREVEYATASFGQGIAVTPIALASALSTVANGGELMRPYIVDQVGDTMSGIAKTTPSVRRRVISRESSEAISRMLSKVVDNTLAGGAVALPGYHIAAKTGTAQIPNSDGAGYSDYYLHTFFGYAPAFDPQFLVLLFLEKPIGVRYASQTLAAPFRTMAEFIIHYYEIPPDR